MTEARTNPHRLYRDRENAMLAGVCAGLADYFGFNRKGVRLAVAIGALAFMPFVIVSYIVLAILLPVKPEVATVDPERAEFWREVSNAPSDVFSRLKHRFRELDHRLQRMEAFVTSREFEIDRELGRTGRGSSAN
ncbi:MAG: envelope stress response membrane protein PspC [Xanthomonadales bacterium]|jgi:phage shock protein C|nr:envelope stress response membrane protein PspC [Xanthomonadales bacterium]